MFTSVVIYVDFYTVAMISCCVARHNICATCRGVSLNHDSHDKLFGGKKVYLVCVYIWMASILTVLPDIIGAPGSFSLSSLPDICDFGCPPEGCRKIIPVVSIINNIVFMSIFYIIIVSYLYKKRKEVGEQSCLYTSYYVQVYAENISDYMQMVDSISMTVSILVLLYLLFLIPMVYTYSGAWPPTSKFSLYVFYIIDPLFYWLFAINAYIYSVTNSRIREAYRTFLKDMWKKMCKEKNQILDNSSTETSAFWIGLRYIKTETE